MLHEDLIDLERIEVVGHDLDNHLYVQDPEVDLVIQGYIFRECAELLGISVEEAEHQFDKYYQGGKGLSGGKTIAAMGVSTPGRDIVQEALEYADVASVLKIDPYVVELINQQRRRYRS